jgi:FecR protein
MLWVTGSAFAKEDAGTVVAVKNRAVIKSDSRAADAKVNEGILLKDTITTLEASKIKLLFIDESVLTLGENSTVVIKDFVHSKDKRGQSIFNLVDGKMRAVVGKTNFEVHTPTAVAAARGTLLLFKVHIVDGRIAVTIICVESSALITGIDPANPGSTELQAGQKITIIMGLPFPSVEQATQEEIESLMRDTDMSMQEIRMLGPVEVMVGPDGVRIEPPINQQPITSLDTTPPPPSTPPPSTPPPTWTPPYSPPPLLAPPETFTPPTPPGITPGPCTNCDNSTGGKK